MLVKLVRLEVPTSLGRSSMMDLFTLHASHFSKVLGGDFPGGPAKKNVLFIIGDRNAKVGSQELSGVTGKFGLDVQNEAGQRLTGFCQENMLVIANTLFHQPRRRPYPWTPPDGQY